MKNLGTLDGLSVRGKSVKSPSEIYEKEYISLEGNIKDVLKKISDWSEKYPDANIWSETEYGYEDDTTTLYYLFYWRAMTDEEIKKYHDDREEAKQYKIKLKENSLTEARKNLQRIKNTFPELFE